MVIIGYERHVCAAAKEILSLLEEDITDEVEMDCRLHSKLTRPKGRAMAGRVIYEHNVVLQLPKDNGANKITIIVGQEECVEAAKLHLILEEQKRFEQKRKNK